MIILLAGGYFWLSLLAALTLLAFAYIVLSHANKEYGSLKKIGVVLASTIFLAALIVLLYGTLYCGIIMKNFYLKYEKFSFDKGAGMNINVKNIRNEEAYNILKEILKKPGMRDWIQEYINQNGIK